MIHTLQGVVVISVVVQGVDDHQIGVVVVVVQGVVVLVVQTGMMLLVVQGVSVGVVVCDVHTSQLAVELTPHTVVVTGTYSVSCPGDLSSRIDIGMAARSAMLLS